MKYGYARISTIYQRKDGNSLEDQRKQLHQEGCDFIVEKQFSGTRMGTGPSSSDFVHCRTVLIATELPIQMTEQVRGSSRFTVQRWVHEANGTPPVASEFGERPDAAKNRSCDIPDDTLTTKTYDEGVQKHEKAPWKIEKIA